MNQATALDGVKVADFTWVVAGPLTTRYLAAFGATVIKVESFQRPDTVRTSRPFKDKKPSLDGSGYYAFYNANKYSISLDLGNPHGRSVARELIAWADIVAENFAPGMMERWGLGYEDIKRIKPDIIMLRTSNQGQTGPVAGQPGLGPHFLPSHMAKPAESRREKDDRYSNRHKASGEVMPSPQSVWSPKSPCI